MKFKVQSLTEVWKDTKLYCLGLVAALGIVVGSVFSYQTVVKPIASSLTIGQVKASHAQVNSSSSSGDSGDKKVDLSYSFYDMTAWLSAYYNAGSSPSGYKTIEGKVGNNYDYHSLLTHAAVEGANSSKNEGTGKWTFADFTWVNPSNKSIGGGGALLGFPDPQIIKGGILGFFASQTSSSTVDYSYDSLGSSKGTYNSLETYAYYGAALEALGIDSSMGSGLMGLHPIKLFAGGAVWIGYILASAAELLFKLVISILQATNPFNWFAKGFEYTWSNAGDNGILAGLTNFVSDMYKIFANFGWLIIIPTTIASLIFMFIFTGNGRQNQGLIKSKAAKFRYFIVYILFLSIGIPVLGTAYTAGLNALGETYSSSNVGNRSSSVDSVIYSAYVDNKTWIENHRMYLPNDVTLVWNVNNGDVGPANKAAVRKFALSINSLINDEAAAAAANSSNSWNLNDKQKEGSSPSKGISALLLRYMIGASYSPSNWETLVKAKLADAIKEGNNSKKGQKDSLVNRLSGSAVELTSKQGYKYMPYVNPHGQDGNPETWGIDVKDKAGWWDVLAETYKFGQYPNIFLSKGFADNWLGGLYSNTGKTTGKVELRQNPSVESKPGLVYGEGKANMSYLEMFNYLNSKFTSNKVRVYSTTNLSSNYTRESHAEVNQVGAGYVHKFMIWLNTVTLLFGIALLAIGYAVGMLIASFKRYINLIMSIFMGTLGMQKAMVKAAAATSMSIFEVVGTMVLYELAKTIYMAIPNILTDGLAAINDGSKVTSTILQQIGFASAAGDLGLFVLTIFALILSVIVLVWMLLMLLRLRAPIMDMADSTFTSLIGKLFYADADMAKGEDSKGGSTGMNSGVAAAGAAGAFFSSNVEGAEGDDNTGFVDGDNEDTVEGGDPKEKEEGDDPTDGEPKEDGDPKDDEPPRPDEREANSKDTEKLGEEVKDQKGVDRSQGKDGKQTEGKDGESGVNGESPEASQQGEDGMSAEEAAQAAEIAKANSQKPSASGSGKEGSGSGKEGSGSGKQGSESKGVTSVSDDDTVNVEASSETPAQQESEAPKSMGTLSPEIPGEKGSGKEGASGKQGEGVKPTSESGKLEKGNKTDSTEQLAKQGAIEAAKELASHAHREAQSNGASVSQKQVTSGETLEGRGSGNQSSVSPAESGKHAPQSGQEQSTSPQGAISPAESGRSSGSGSSSAPTRSQQHRQQAKVEAIGARESANQAKADAISSARDAGQGTRNVASGVGSIAAGVTAMATGDASGNAMVGQGVQQTIEGAKQLGSSISSGVSSVKNTVASVGQGVSAVTNAGASVGTAIADSKVGQATGKVASKVGSVAGAGATALGGAVLNATLEGAGMQPIARRVNGSTPASSAGTVTSTVTTTTTSGGAGGATTTTTVTSQTQAGSGGGNQQAQSSGGVLRRVGNHVENEVRQSLADMAPGTGISNGGTTSTVQRQAGSKGAQGTTVVNTTTTSSSGSQGGANQTVRVTSTGQSNGGSTTVTTTTTSNGGSNQTVQKQVTSQGGQNGTVLVNTTTTTSGQTQTVQKSAPTSGSNAPSHGGSETPVLKSSSNGGSGQPPVQKPTTGSGSGSGPVGDGHGYQPEQRQTPSSGGSGQTTQTTTTTTSVILNRGGESGPRNVPQSKGNILKKAGDHVESEVHKALADMGGTPTSSANVDDIATEFMEKMKREDLKKARKKRFNRPK